MSERDYLIVSLGGVQQFISASRKTGDLWASSRIYSHLAERLCTLIVQAGGEVIFPSAEGDALPNRLFVSLKPGTGSDVGRACVENTMAGWEDLASAVFPGSEGSWRGALESLPKPTWVAIDFATTPLEYPDAWRLLNRAAVSRKRIKDFSGYTGAGSFLCSLCGLRSNHPLAKGVRAKGGERLCPVCQIKRSASVLTAALGQSISRFPSTASIASAPFRSQVLDAIEKAGSGELQSAIRGHLDAVRTLESALEVMDIPPDAPVPHGLPGLEDRCSGVEHLLEWVRLDGDWCYPSTWDHEAILRERGNIHTATPELLRACAGGIHALRKLKRSLLSVDNLAIGPTPYLAVVVQDADRMGRAVLDSGPADRPFDQIWHQDVSKALVQASVRERSVAEDALGRTVYSGGDDLLSLVPLKNALEVAAGSRKVLLGSLREAIPKATVSTAVVYFHKSYPLREALERSRLALDWAKQKGRDRLAVVALRRGGERARTLLSWDVRNASAVDRIQDVLGVFEGGLSPRILQNLASERAGIADLSFHRLHASEIGRLTARHGKPDAGDKLLQLAPGGLDTPELVDEWISALEVARFISSAAKGGED